MAIYRDDGIVLRTHKLGEADRIVTILGRKTGRIRAVAKGVRRTKSRLGARVEPFTHVDLLLYTGRSLDVITQAETVRPYGEPLASDYPRYTAGTAMLETAERLTPVEKEPALRQFLLLVGGLRALGEGQHDPRLVLDAFLLRSLAVAGYAPALEECAVCGTRAPTPVLPDPALPEPDLPQPGPPQPGPPQLVSPELPGMHLPGMRLPEMEPAGSGQPRRGYQAAPSGQSYRALRSFGIAAGGLTCQGCRRPGAATPSIATIALMSALMRGDWELADRSERRHQAECSGLVAAYLQWHLEHSIRSLKHVEHA
ncbi:MAG: DNA repair protein RecO [Streptosporangiaceae bacterium]